MKSVVTSLSMINSYQVWILRRDQVKQDLTRLIRFELVWTSLDGLCGQVWKFFDIKVWEKWSQKQENYFRKGSSRFKRVLTWIIRKETSLFTRVRYGPALPVTSYHTTKQRPPLDNKLTKWAKTMLNLSQGLENPSSKKSKISLFTS